MASGKAAQTGQQRPVGSTNAHEASSDMDRSNFLPLRCLSCRWHVIAHMVHFPQTWNPCQRRSNAAPVPCPTRFWDESCSAPTPDGGGRLPLPAPQHNGSVPIHVVMGCLLVRSIPLFTTNPKEIWHHILTQRTHSLRC